MRRLKANFSARLLAAPVEEMEIEEKDQSHSGKGTSLLPSQMKGGMPALFKMAIPWPSGGRVFDIGAGRPEMAETLRAWFADKGVTYLPYDRFNGGAYNGETVAELKKQKADVATASNLLNVIPDADNRLSVLRTMFNALKPGGKFYITVHRQSGKTPGESGPDKWQNHKKPVEYLEEIQQVFPNASAKGDLISGSRQ